MKRPADVPLKPRSRATDRVAAGSPVAARSIGLLHRVVVCRVCDMRRIGTLHLAALLVFACMGCGNGGHGLFQNERGEVLRLIEGDGLALFDPTPLFQQEQVFRWEFSDRSNSGPWKVSGADLQHNYRGGSLTMQSSGKSIRLDAEVDIDGTSVNVVEIRIPGFGGGVIAMQWCGPNQPFSAERKLSVDGRNNGEGGVFRFLVGKHQQWPEEIAKIRITIWMAPRKLIRLRSIGGLRRNLIRGRFESAANQPWKFDIHQDVRNGRIGVPERPLNWPVEVPAHGRLEFAYGLSKPTATPVDFSVSLQVDGSLEPHLLWSETVGPDSAPGQQGWTPVEVDMNQFAGQSAELRFETSADFVLHPDGGLPIWANPEIRSHGRKGPKPNVVLLVIDTLRADRLSSYGYRRQTSPNIDRWAREKAVLFRNVVAPAPWTLPAHVSLFSGLDAHRHGVNFGRGAPRQITMLAEYLRREGYKTHAITGGLYLHPRFGLAQGFDSFRYWPNPASTEELESHLEVAFDLLNSVGPDPFFLFFHTYEVHNPYRPRQPYFGLNSEFTSAYWMKSFEREMPPEDGFAVRSSFIFEAKGKPDKDAPLPTEMDGLPSDLYDSGVSFVDQHLSRLLERLEATDLANKVLIILTSDHGEMLGEHGVAGHSYLYEENLMVPLLIRHPEGEGRGTEVETQVRLIDILSTVLDVVGIPPPEDLDGRSLLPFIEGRNAELPEMAVSYAASSNHGLSMRHNNQLKYIFRDAAWPEINGQELVFDLREDPSEVQTLPTEHRIVRSSREVARQILEEEALALHVRMRNTMARGWIRGKLSGPMVTTKTVKTVSPPLDCIRWEGNTTLSFRVPPETEYTVLLMNGSEAALSLVLEPPGGDEGQELRTHLSGDDLRERRFYFLTQSAWEENDHRPHVIDASIEVFWSSDGWFDDVVEPTTDDATLEQLRALGYVE